MEQMLTKDIDKFLLEAEWEAASVGGGASRASRGQSAISARSGSQARRLRGLERRYLP